MQLQSLSGNHLLQLNLEVILVSGFWSVLLGFFLSSFCMPKEVSDRGICTPFPNAVGWN